MHASDVRFGDIKTWPDTESSAMVSNGAQLLRSVPIIHVIDRVPARFKRLLAELQSSRYLSLSVTLEA